VGAALLDASGDDRAAVLEALGIVDPGAGKAPAARRARKTG
jgi:hypothetical protein